MFYTVNKNVISGPLGVGWGMSIAFDMEAVSNMETEAADCRRLAAKFKLKAECARLSATIALFLGLERRHILLAQLFEKEAEKLRGNQGSQI
jgi:hypothetical protein